MTRRRTELVWVRTRAGRRQVRCLSLEHVAAYETVEGEVCLVEKYTGLCVALLRGAGARKAHLLQAQLDRVLVAARWDGAPQLDPEARLHGLRQGLRPLVERWVASGVARVLDPGTLAKGVD